MKKVTGKSGFVYEGDETPVERLRNKLSVVFLVVESGKCDANLRNEAIKVLPEIVEHLDNIEEFYSPPKIRSFRVRHKEIHWDETKGYRIVKHRDFVNIEKFKKYGIELYERYNSFRDSIGEICEMKDGKWVKLTEEEIKKLYNESN